MKNYFIICLCLSVFLTACKGDDDAGDSFNEENSKQTLEDNTIEVLEAIQGFRNDSSLKEIEEFLEIIVDEFEEEDNIIVEEAKAALAFAKQANNLSDDEPVMYFYEPEPIYYEEEESLEEEYNDLVGLHVWNEFTNEFDHTENDSDNIVVSITQNNKTAVLTISNFSSEIYMDEEELPMSIEVNLKINDSTIMEMSHSLELDDDNESIISMTQSFDLGSMSYNSNISTVGDDVSFIESISIGDTNIFSINATINNFEALESDDLIGEGTSISTNTSLSFGKTTLNINGEIPEDASEMEVDSDDDALELLNDWIFLSITTDDTKVADGEFYVDSEDELNIRMIFEDGSKAELESYFSVGFEDIETHMENTLEVYSDFTE